MYRWQNLSSTDETSQDTAIQLLFSKHISFKAAKLLASLKLSQPLDGLHEVMGKHLPSLSRLLSTAK